MAEKKHKEETEHEAAANRGQSNTCEDGTAEVEEAAACVQQAREQLRAAEAFYRELREKAGQKIEQARGKTVGDVMDTILNTTRKHPVPSLLAAGFLGFLLGRLFRR
jgi:hypothetical protein